MTRQLFVLALSLVPAVAFAGGGQDVVNKAPSPWTWVVVAVLVIVMVIMIVASSLRKRAEDIGYEVPRIDTDGINNEKGKKQ